jgi:hypothetical protein
MTSQDDSAATGDTQPVCPATQLLGSTLLGLTQGYPPTGARRARAPGAAAGARRAPRWAATPTRKHVRRDSPRRQRASPSSMSRWRPLRRRCRRTCSSRSRCTRCSRCAPARACCACCRVAATRRRARAPPPAPRPRRRRSRPHRPAGGHGRAEQRPGGGRRGGRCGAGAARRRGPLAVHNTLDQGLGRRGACTCGRMRARRSAWDSPRRLTLPDPPPHAPL